MPVNPARTQVSNWDVKWKTVALGGVDKVTPDLKLVTKVIKIGTLGDIVLGERIIGLDGTVKIEVRELDEAQYQALCPWAPGGGAAIPLTPAVFHKDLYDYADLLTLHPTHLAADVVNQDLTFLKAVPRLINPGERDGVGDNKMLLEFSFFPDRDSLLAVPPVVLYGYIGAPPEE